MPRELPEIQVRFDLSLERLIKASNDAAARLESFNIDTGTPVTRATGGRIESASGFFSSLNPFDRTPSGAVKISVDESTTGSVLGPVSGNLLGAAIGPLAPVSVIARLLATGLADEAVDLSLRFAGSVTRTLIREGDTFVATLGAALLREIPKAIRSSILPQVQSSPAGRVVASAAPEGAGIRDLIPEAVRNLPPSVGGDLFAYRGSDSYARAILPNQVQTYINEPLTAARHATELGLDLTLGATPVGAAILGFNYAFFGSGGLSSGEVRPDDPTPGVIDAYLYENDPGFYQYDPGTGTGYSPGYIPLNSGSPLTGLEEGILQIPDLLRRVGSGISDFFLPPAGAAELPELTDYSQALELIQSHEGLRLEPYYDPVGLPTVGYGQLLSNEPYADLSQFSSITETDATTFLRQRLNDIDGIINRLVQVPLDNNQRNALASFIYNVGEGNFRNSTLLRELNAGNYEAAGAQFPSWIYAGGRQLPGLVTRREDERSLFERAISSISNLITPPAGAAGLPSVFRRLSRFGPDDPDLNRYLTLTTRRYNEVYDPERLGIGIVQGRESSVVPEGVQSIFSTAQTEGVGVLDDFFSLTDNQELFDRLSDELNRDLPTFSTTALDQNQQFRRSAFGVDLRERFGLDEDIFNLLLSGERIASSSIAEPLVGRLPRNERLFRGVVDPANDASFRTPRGVVGLDDLQPGEIFTLDRALYTSRNPVIAERFALGRGGLQASEADVSLHDRAIIELNARRGSRFSISQGGVTYDESEIAFVDPFQRYRYEGGFSGVRALNFDPNDVDLNQIDDLIDENALIDAIHEEIEIDVARGIFGDDVADAFDRGDLLASDIATANPDYYDRLYNDFRYGSPERFINTPPLNVHRITQLAAGGAAVGLGASGVFGGTQEAQAAGPLFGLFPENPEDAIPTLPNLPDFPNLLDLTNQENINEGAGYVAQYRPGLLAETSIQLNRNRGLLGGVGRAFPQTRGTIDPLFESLSEFQVALDESISELPFGQRIREQAIIAREEIDGLSEASDELSRRGVTALTAAITQTRGWADLLSDLPGLAQSALIEIAVIRPASNLVSDLLASTLGGFFGNIFGNRGELAIDHDAHIDTERQYRQRQRVVVNQTVNGADPTRAEQYARDAINAGGSP